MLFRKTLNTNLKYYFNVFPPLETALEFLECTFKYKCFALDMLFKYLLPPELKCLCT